MKENTSIRLKKIMSDRNLKQVDIINKCEPICRQHNVKLTKNYLSQYISGKVEPGQRTLTILGIALNVNEAWLMGYNVPMERDSMSQSEESPVLKAIYNSDFKDSKLAEEFIIKKLFDNMELDARDYELLSAYKKLNTEGKAEAIHRVSELSFIPGYFK